MAVNKCIKYLLFIFNLLFWLSGCLILAVTIYLKVSKESNKITSEAIPGIDLMIAIGVIIMVLGFLGCCGAIKENRCMLLIFFIGLLIIFILLVAAGIVGAVFMNKVKPLITETLGQNLPLTSQPVEFQQDIQKLETQLFCCGLVKGPADWGSNIPVSCDCKDPKYGCTLSGGRQVYNTPCINSIIDVLEKFSKVVLAIAFTIAVLLIFGMAFSMTLYCQIGKKEGPTTA
ncbi:tetraspanin-8-like [Thalassophryne amazonica]|uniref:tetraspanin-8-like n=1 Tax=Thalassophryne amazonica TaxID=390379 RepID=UPI001470D82D|nr:tetraspanin-8-like [Thalassophryne amazonica]